MGDVARPHCRPTPRYAAFTISLFATAFMGVWFISLFDGLKARVEAADINTLIAIYRSLSLLQAQFVTLTGADLPYVPRRPPPAARQP